MHIDLNSCFASIEQQCNALLRGKPVAVAAYASPRGCILSPSVEAKRRGVTTGMRVADGRRRCPDLVVLPPDPWKYRWVNRQLERLFREYTPHSQMKSIDEAVLHFAHTPQGETDLVAVAQTMKRRIRQEIGDWLTVSVGLGPNRYLAKTGAGLHKPDGLNEVNWWNIEAVLESLRLEDLNGINQRQATRLRRQGIVTPIDFYRADIATLRQAFHSVVGLDWHLRLHGYEIDDWESGRRSFSHMYSLPQPIWEVEALKTILAELIHSLGYRMRRAGFMAGGVSFGCVYRDGTTWHRQRVLDESVYATGDLLQAVYAVLMLEPSRTWTSKVTVGVFDLTERRALQATWWQDEVRKRRLTEAVDTLHQTFGQHVLFPGRMLGGRTGRRVPDFVAFGGVKELASAPELATRVVEPEAYSFLE